MMAAGGLGNMRTAPAASTSSAPVLPCTMRLPHCAPSTSRAPFRSSVNGRGLVHSSRAPARTERASALRVYAVKDGAVLDRKLRVAVIGGGPSGACTAETLAKGGIETILIERKLDNCKVILGLCLLAAQIACAAVNDQGVRLAMGGDPAL